MIKYSNFRQGKPVKLLKTGYQTIYDTIDTAIVDVTYFFFFKEKDVPIFQFRGSWKRLQNGKFIWGSYQLNRLSLANTVASLYEES